MLTENQIRRFQRLANCESPQSNKAVLTEALGIGGWIATILFGLLGGELQGHRYNLEQEQDIRLGKMQPEDFVEQRPSAFFLRLWNRLTDTAEAKAEEGDSSLAALLSTLESEAEGGAQQLSPEQIAMIQERFGDDEELAGLLAQLAEVEEEDYREVLSQVEQYIRSKLGT